MLALLVATLALYLGRQQDTYPFVRRLCVASLPGAMGGVVNTFLKCTTEVIKAGEWSRAEAWVIHMGSVLGGLVQFVFLNDALKRYEALYVVPVYQAVLMVSSILTSQIFFGDFKDLDG